MNLHICIDRILPPADDEPAPNEDPIDATQLNRMRLAADRRKIWPGEWRVLAVRFLEGDAALQHRIAQVAHEWTQHANLRLLFNNAPGAPIRISFAPGPSWSYIGTDALDPRLGPDDPTMNFGWLTPATPQDELQRVVLHEFGHALGMIHEHQSPSAAIPWDREALYAYYAQPPNRWTPAQVDANVIARYNAEIANASAFDPQSIMLYPIPREFTRGEFEVGWNRTLSPTDRAFIAEVYPRES